MLKVFSLTEMPDPIPRGEEKELLRSLWSYLGTSIEMGASIEDNVGALNHSVQRAFQEHGIECAFVGPYGIVPGKDEVTNPLIASVGHGCADISVYKGAISTVFRLYGEQSLYVPSVKDLERQAPHSHHECRSGESMPDMAEIIIALPKFYHGGSVIQECLDIDVLRVNPFSEVGVAELEEIIVPQMRIVFPSDITYIPIAGVHVRPSN